MHCARLGEVRQPGLHEGAVGGGDAAEAVQADAVRVQAGGAVCGDGDDRIVAAGLLAGVGEEDAAVGFAADRTAVRVGETIDRLAHVHAGAAHHGTDAGKGLLVADHDGRRAVKQVKISIHTPLAGSDRRNETFLTK